MQKSASDTGAGLDVNHIKTLSSFRKPLPRYLSLTMLLANLAALAGLAEMGVQIAEYAAIPFCVIGSIFVYESMRAHKAATIAYCNYIERLDDEALMLAVAAKSLPRFEQGKVASVLQARLQAGRLE